MTVATDTKEKSVGQWRNRIVHGDALTVLRSMPDGFVQTVVTSPPYW